MDLPEEIDAWVDALRGTFDVLEVSKPIPNRGDSRMVRVYVELRLRGPSCSPKPTASTATAAAPTEPDRLAAQLRRVNNVVGWARARITSLHNKRDKTPEPQKARRRECDVRAEEIQRLVDELDKALGGGERQ
ncbi:hypothetical protein [Actinomadura bangladeshensis]|uniref:Uncharacterized protein n=1 Tax=Actinomadura bangladeshensis TaxID=453573 RepID=A0A6L9QC62_9ACTN|nr:hypothetical protein [Actinomadura bangladeshensis]NEA22658.1 hypothetical protein [Actinomadura bangladeshensis]